MKSKKQKTNQLTVKRQWLIISALTVVLFGFATTVYLLNREMGAQTVKGTSYIETN